MARTPRLHLLCSIAGYGAAATIAGLFDNWLSFPMVALVGFLLLVFRRKILSLVGAALMLASVAVTVSIEFMAHNDLLDSIVSHDSCLSKQIGEHGSCEDALNHSSDPCVRIFMKGLEDSGFRVKYPGQKTCLFMFRRGALAWTYLVGRPELIWIGR